MNSDTCHAGVSKDPTLIVDNQLFLEGLIQAEEITEGFKVFFAGSLKEKLF